MRLLSIGECMVELSAAGDGLWRQGFAGDSFNTAWYARACLPAPAEVVYLTRISCDPLSNQMLAFMSRAGIDTRAVTRHPECVPGLYMIMLSHGERSFTYRRDRSAARTLADDPATLAADCVRADWLYTSGITLAILPDPGRMALLEAMAAAPGRRLRPQPAPALVGGCGWPHGPGMRRSRCPRPNGSTRSTAPARGTRSTVPSSRHECRVPLWRRPLPRDIHLPRVSSAIAVR